MATLARERLGDVARAIELWREVVTRFGDDSGSVTLNWSTATGTATAGSDYVAASGQVTYLPGGGNSQTITVNVIGDVVSEADVETFFVHLSVVSGSALLADEDGQGTIVDNDTKFYVVNDGSPDRTYEYGTAGNAGENYSLNTGNTAPRGAASNVGGNKVWVVDANKKVYVYNTSGGLLGSWTAGGLHVQAQLEGIATNGTDIWLVDNKQDKVFKYTGAASLLSGSQNAASSFNLNSGNGDPKDIVTDGASLWVVNDSSTDKVFKYNVAGSLLGSWTMTGAGSAPTGITLDPSSVSHLWIVDSGTDKVYQYDNAASRISGSQSPSVNFALAAGNTNPQGIADPPVAEMVSSVPAPASNGVSACMGRITVSAPGPIAFWSQEKSPTGAEANDASWQSAAFPAATPFGEAATDWASRWEEMVTTRQAAAEHSADPFADELDSWFNPLRV